MTKNLGVYEQVLDGISFGYPADFTKVLWFRANPGGRAV